MKTTLRGECADFLCGSAIWKQVVCICSLIVLMVVSFACIKTPAEPAAPSWQTQLTLPIVDRTYYFSELVAKDDKFETLVNGEVIYRPESLQNNPIALPLPSISPVKAEVSTMLGPVPLTLPPLPSVGVSVSQIIGRTPPQTPWSFGDVSTNQNQNIISDTATFDYVEFENGRLTITLTNTNNFDVIFPTGIQVVNVFSKSDTLNVLVTFTVAPLRANTSQTLVNTISGKMMSSRLKMKFLVQTSGLDGKVIDPNGKISSGITIDGGTTGSSPTLKSAKILVPGTYGTQTISGGMKLISDSIFIKRAEFYGGGFDLTITNTIPIDILAGLTIQELVNKKTGLPFRLKANGTGAEQNTVLIQSTKTFVQTIDLNEYVFISSRIKGMDTLATDSVFYTMKIGSPGSTTDKRVIAANNSFTIAIVPKMIAGSMSIAKFQGVIPPTTTTIDETVQTDFATSTDKLMADGVTIDSSIITFKLFTKTSFTADVDLSVTAFHNGVRGASMKVPPNNANGSFRIVPGDTSRIIFSQATVPTMTAFMNSFVSNGKFQLPDQFRLEGRATIEPVDVYNTKQVGTVTNTDSIYSSIEFSFPMRIGIQNGIFNDTTEFKNSADNKDKWELLNSGRVIFQIENTFPVSGDVSLMMMGSKNAKDTLLNLTKTPLHVEGGIYSETGTNVASKSFSFISLEQGEAAKLSSATVTAVKAHMQTGNATHSVLFRPTDYIRVKAYGTINATVDFDKMK